MNFEFDAQKHKNILLDAYN